MHEHLIEHLSTIGATGSGGTLATASGAASDLVWVLLSGITALVAVIRILRQPAENWSHRNWSKLAWVLAVLYLAPPLGGYPMPIGAIAAIWRTRSRQPGQAMPAQLPMAGGSSDWPWPWGAK